MDIFVDEFAYGITLGPHRIIGNVDRNDIRFLLNNPVYIRRIKTEMSRHPGDGCVIFAVAEYPQLFPYKLRPQSYTCRTRVRRTPAGNIINQIFASLDYLLVLDHLTFRKNNNRMAVSKKSIDQN